MSDMMKALVYEKPGRKNGVIKMIPIPVCGDNDVLMKVMACAICKPAESSHDRETGSLLGEYPATPGHEFAGEVVQTGRNVTNVAVGDRIIASNAYPCGTCYYCQTGRPEMCLNYKCQGHNMQGGFAQYMVCKAEKCYKFSEDVSYDQACMTELINCCKAAINNAEIKYGDNVVIIGCGSSGNLIAQLAKNSNAGRVVSLDKIPSKLEIAKEMGVETVLVDENDFSKHEEALKEMFPNGIDVLIDAAGDDGDMLESGLKLLAAGGRLVLYSFFYFEPKTFKVDPGLMIKKGLKIVSAPLQSEWYQSVKAIEDGKVDPRLVTSKICKLDDYFEALDYVLQNPEALKVIIHPND